MVPEPSTQVARAVAVVGLLEIGLGHLLDTPRSFHESPYLGVGHIGVLGACLVGAAVLTASGAAGAWWFTFGISCFTLLGFTLSRTIGLPLAKGEIGAWSAPLGLAMAFLEACLLILSAWVLAWLYQTARLDRRTSTTFEVPRAPSHPPHSLRRS